MEKIVIKQNSLCFIIGIVDLLYTLFVVSQLGVFAGKFNMKGLYAPGLILGLLLFPVTIFFLWKRRVQIEWIDYTLVVIPLLLWLLIIPGGSFTNFLFINFPFIWTFSLLYLIRFSSITKDRNIYIIALFLWMLVVVTSFCFHYFMPILPE